MAYLILSVSSTLFTQAFAIGEDILSCGGPTQPRCLTVEETKTVNSYLYYSCGGTRPCPSEAQFLANMQFYYDKMRSCRGNFCYQMNLGYGSQPPVVDETGLNPITTAEAEAAAAAAAAVPAVPAAPSISNFVIPEAKSDWGCEVLLCLSNPNGAMAVAACVPPIKKLFKALAKGKPFPSCAMGGAESQNYAFNEYTPFDPCPADYPIHVQDIDIYGINRTPERICRNDVQTEVCGGGANSAPVCTMEYGTSSQGVKELPNKMTVINSGKVVSSFRW